MSLKVKISKEDFDALSEDVKKEYKKKGSDYVLDVDDGEIAAEAKRARDREKVRADEEKEKREEAEARVAELEADGNGKKKTIDDIEKAHKKQLEKITGEKDTLINKFKKFLEKLLVSDQAKTLAGEIAKKPNVLLPHITARLMPDLDGDEPALKILDKNGKPSSLTLDDLKKEFVDNEDFADIIIGSKASGSGGGGSGGGSGGAKKPSEYTEAERVHLFKTNRPEFERLFPIRST